MTNFCREIKSFALPDGFCPETWFYNAFGVINDGKFLPETVERQ